MQLFTINTGTFKLDGGAMFGVVPKTIWNKMYPADENNLCTWALRSLLIITENKKILIDSGIGNKQIQGILKHYHINAVPNLLESLKEINISPDDITDVIHSHLHFDHCGGSIDYKDDKTIPVFPNANYWVSSKQWEWATNPNKREIASFLTENILPMKEYGLLKLIEEDTELYDGVFIELFNGHTSGQIIPHICYKNSIIVFMADLIPSTTHIHLPFIMSYDINALQSLKEKEEFLKKAVAENYVLFFQHDNYNECCTIQETEKGFRVKETFLLKDIDKYCFKD